MTHKAERRPGRPAERDGARDRSVSKRLRKLLFNHLDAWAVSLSSAGLALLLHDAFTVRTLLLLAGIGVGYWLAFAFNDYCDAEDDAADPAKAARNFFVHTQVSRALLLSVSALVVSFLALCFLQFGRRGFWVAAVSFIVMWGYSAPPLHFKNRPGIDLLVHALSVQSFPYAIPLIVIDAAWTPLDYMILAITATSSLSGQLEQEVRDYQVDVRTGTRNFATAFGLQTAVRGMKLATLLLALLSVGGLVTGVIPLYLAPIGLIALPAMIHRFTRPDEAPRSERLAHSLVVIGSIYVGSMVGYFLWIWGT